MLIWLNDGDFGNCNMQTANLEENAAWNGQQMAGLHPQSTLGESDSIDMNGVDKISETHVSTVQQPH